MLIATHSALEADGDLLTDSQRRDIDALVDALRSLIEAGAAPNAPDAPDAATIEAATQALARGTEAFAAQRMNRGIQQALAGKNVQSL
jgi:molecular chaperone HscA